MKNGTSSTIAYFDTGYIPTKNSKFILDFQDVWRNAVTNYMGVRDPNLAILSYYSTSKIGAMVNGNSNIQSINWNTSRHTHILGNGIYSIDGITYATPTLSSLPTTKTVWIFNTNKPNISPDTYANGRFYSAQIYENDILFRNYIPVINSDQTPGLYDTVTQTFITKSGNGRVLYEL